jgi:hypothetical protein
MRTLTGYVAALGLCILLVPGESVNAQGNAVQAAQQNATATKKKRPRVVVTKGGGKYGFLPGYRQPDLNNTRPSKTYHYWRGYDWDGFPVGSWGTGGYGGMWYRGRFTNGIGPCWTRTPIGPMWNCG